MSDVIYRQAAIDAVRNQDAIISPISDDVLLVDKAMVMTELMMLPSAQPELDEWCTDCKEYDQERHCCPKWNRVIRQTLKDAELERKKERWIPCSEQLPETDMCRTLTTISTPYKGTNVRSGCFYRGLFMNDNGDTWNATDKEVLAWMPFPEPWRGGEDGNQTE